MCSCVMVRWVVFMRFTGGVGNKADIDVLSEEQQSISGARIHKRAIMMRTVYIEVSHECEFSHSIDKRK